MAGRILSVNVGVPRAVPYASNPGVTAIDKRPVTGPVRVAEFGLAGDTQANRKFHGGPYQAVYAYDTGDVRFWEREADRPLGPGAFGENLTVAGLGASTAVVGELWRIRTVELRVTCPRIPCRTFAGFWGVPDLIARFLAAGRPGTYLSVATGGELAAGDPVEVVDRPAHGVTVADLMRVRTGDRTGIERVAAATDWLPPEWRGWVEKVLAVKAIR
jgi:MOSC domain-containing protein YiiM